MRPGCRSPASRTHRCQRTERRGPRTRALPGRSSDAGGSARQRSPHPPEVQLPPPHSPYSNCTNRCLESQEKHGVNFAPRTPAALWPAGPTPADLWPAGPTPTPPSQSVPWRLGTALISRGPSSRELVARGTAATPSSRSVPWPLGTALISRHERRRPYGPRARPQLLLPSPSFGRYDRLVATNSLILCNP